MLWGDKDGWYTVPDIFVTLGQLRFANVSVGAGNSNVIRLGGQQRLCV
jgi:hypothetical protein